LECPSIIVEELAAGYGKRLVVKGVDFRVERGEVLAVIGPNGSGKTTLLRVLAGIIPIVEGRVCICGKSYKAGSLVRAHSLVSYAPATPIGDPWARVRDMLLAARYGVSRSLFMERDEDKCAIEEAARMLGIEELLDRFFGELSSGEKKLVLIASAIARKTPVVLLDEPMAFLDLANQSKVLKVIRNLASKGYIVVLATHELHLVPHYADKVLLISRGVQVGYGPLDKVLDRRLLEHVYGTRLVEFTREDGQRLFVPE